MPPRPILSATFGVLLFLFVLVFALNEVYMMSFLLVFPASMLCVVAVTRTNARRRISRVLERSGAAGA